jgi:transposase-like protein
VNFMITTAFTWRICQSTNVKLFGHNSSGTQRYHSNDCGTTRVLKPQKSILARSRRINGAFLFRAQQLTNNRAYFRRKSWHSI